SDLCCRWTVCFDVVAYGAGVERRHDTQRAPERPTTHRLFETRGRGMQVRPTTWGRTIRIRYENMSALVRHRDDPHQVGAGLPLAATNARTNWLRARRRVGRPGSRGTHRRQV